MEFNTNKEYSFLIIVAHPDDFEIGMLGFICSLVKKKIKFKINLAVMSCDNDIRKKEQLDSITSLQKKLGIEINFILYDFPDTSLYKFKDDIKNKIKIFYNNFNSNSKEIIFTHHSQDMHQDHKTIYNSVIQSLRSSNIIGFEILKLEFDLITKPIYFKIDSDSYNFKIKHIISMFKSQNNKYWFNNDSLSSIGLLRGVGARSKFAECFSIERYTYD